MALTMVPFWKPLALSQGEERKVALKGQELYTRLQVPTHLPTTEESCGSALGRRRRRNPARKRLG